MAAEPHSIRCTVTKFTGPAAWHFAVLPKARSAEIKTRHGESARNWGSLPVRATLGGVAWKTSIFYDSKSATYLLPLKAAIRKKTGVGAGDTITIALQLLQ